MSDTTRKYMDILSKKRAKFFQDYEHNSWDDLYEYAFDDGYDTAIESMQEEIDKRDKLISRYEEFMPKFLESLVEEFRRSDSKSKMSKGVKDEKDNQ